MNMFKLRYSYGKVGNDQLGTRFPYLYTISGKYTEKVDDKDVERYSPDGIGEITDTIKSLMV